MPKRAFRKLRANYPVRKRFAKRRALFRRRAFRRLPLAVRTARSVAKLRGTVRRITPTLHKFVEPTSGAAFGSELELTRWDVAAGSLQTLALANIAQGNANYEREGTEIFIKRVNITGFMQWHHDGYSSVLPTTGDGAASTKFRRMRFMVLWDKDYLQEANAILTPDDIFDGLPTTPANGDLEPFMARYRSRLLFSQQSPDYSARKRHFSVLYDRNITFWIKPDSSVYDRCNFSISVPVFKKLQFTGSAATTGVQQVYILMYTDRTPSASAPIDRVTARLSAQTYFYPN